MFSFSTICSKFSLVLNSDSRLETYSLRSRERARSFWRHSRFALESNHRRSVRLVALFSHWNRVSSYRRRHGLRLVAAASDGRRRQLTRDGAADRRIGRDGENRGAQVGGELDLLCGKRVLFGADGMDVGENDGERERGEAETEAKLDEQGEGGAKTK
jgi:hypothetical protein